MPIAETLVAFTVIPFFWGLICSAVAMIGTTIGVDAEVVAMFAGGFSFCSAALIMLNVVKTAGEHMPAELRRVEQRLTVLRMLPLVALASAIPALVILRLGSMGIVVSVLAVLAMLVVMLFPGRARKQG